MCYTCILMPPFLNAPNKQNDTKDNVNDINELKNSIKKIENIIKGTNRNINENKEMTIEVCIGIAKLLESEK